MIRFFTERPAAVLEQTAAQVRAGPERPEAIGGPPRPRGAATGTALTVAQWRCLTDLARLDAQSGGRTWHPADAYRRNTVRALESRGLIARAGLFRLATGELQRVALQSDQQRPAEDVRLTDTGVRVLAGRDR
jgi:hypothetical protein